jgi:hypothetical protein
MSQKPRTRGFCFYGCDEQYLALPSQHEFDFI